MARKYEVEGTKSFLWWAIGLFALFLWAVKDGWFPSPEMEEHVTFNKILAVLSVVGSVTCGIIHRAVK